MYSTTSLKLSKLGISASNNEENWTYDHAKHKTILDKEVLIQKNFAHRILFKKTRTLLIRNVFVQFSAQIKLF